VLLVRLLRVDPLMIHVTNIVLILLAELVHTTDKIATLACQIVELVIEGYFVLAVLDLVVAKVLQLGLEIADAAVCSIMVLL